MASSGYEKGMTFDETWQADLKQKKKTSSASRIDDRWLMTLSLCMTTSVRMKADADNDTIMAADHKSRYSFLCIRRK